MAGIVGLFASIGEHIPVLNKEKFGQPDPEGHVNSFHYRGTVLLIMAFCILVTCTEWISGTGSIINCLHHGAIPDNVIETYCYIMGTFSVPKHYVDFDTQIGNHVAQTGVGPYNPDEDYITVKAYYQWVPFMLFLQGLMFYLPHVIFKNFEAGKIKLIITGLNQWNLDDEDRHSKEKDLANYLIETRGTHVTWCLQIMGASFLYLVNVVGQIFFTDCFLGYEFSTYGVTAASFLERAAEKRTDPMSRVFPRMTKCTFQKYGPSGTIQRHDAQCILPINIINEKIYVFLWFWFCILSVITLLDFCFTVLIIFTRRARYMIISRKLKLSTKRQKAKIDVNLIVDNIDFADWKLLYHLLRNMDSLVFMEFCEHFTEALEKEQAKCNGVDDCLRLKDFMGHSHDNLNKSSDNGSIPDQKEESFLTINDGNYLKSASTKESQI